VCGSIAVFGLIIGIYLPYQTPLYNASEEIEIRIQSNATSFGKFFFKAISTLGDVPTYLFIAILMMAFYKRDYAFYFMFALILMAFGMSVLKMAFHAKRPFLTNI